MLQVHDADRLKKKVRLRACGIVRHESRLLMIHLAAPTRPEPFWTVPGGGVQFGEPVFAAVERELKEETGLSVVAEQLLYVHEFIEPPFHAVEFYVRCRLVGGTLRTGADPELPPDAQMILHSDWVPFSELKNRPVNPPFLQNRLEKDLANPLFSTEFLTS